MRPREANSPEAPELMRGRVGWDPQFFRLAAKAGDPHPAQLRAPSRAPWRTARVLGSGPGERQLLCQRGDRAKSGSEALP